MNNKKFYFELDIKGRRYVSDIRIVQNDKNSNEFEVKLKDDLEDYVITNEKVEVAFKKPDGTFVLQDCTFNKSIITILPVDQVLVVSGKVLAEIRILEKEKLLTSTQFEFMVTPNIINDDSIESTSEYSALDELVLEAKEMQIKLEQATKEIENLATNETVIEIKSDVENLKTSKVDKEAGKGLSTNDYTDLEKAEVAKIKEKADKTYVDKQVENKADKKHKHYMTEIVTSGIDDTNVGQRLQQQDEKIRELPDKTYVDNGLNNKADKTELNKKIDKTSITSDLEGIDENKVLSQKAGSLLFTSVNDGKGYIANSIIDLDEDVNVSNESTFTELGDAITNNLTKYIPPIYGFEIDENNSNPETAVTYIRDNVGYTPMKVSDYGNWKSFIKKISIPVLLKGGKVQYKLQYDNFTKRVDGTKSILTGEDGDVMIRFRHLWVKEEKVSSTKRNVYLSTENFDGATSYTKMTEKGYNQLSWGILMTLQHLYLLLYKDRDSQTALGRGYVDGNSDFANTGGTNTKPYFFGETTGKQQMKFCGIESFWDNKYNFVDGIVSDNNYDLKIGYTNFNDSGSGYKLIKTPMTSSVYGYFKSTMGGEAGYIRTDNAGSSSTGYCDSSQVNAGMVAFFGCNHSNGNYAGAFSVRLYKFASFSYSNYGSRLCFVDDDYFYVGAYTGYVEGDKLRSISGKIPTGNETIGKFRTYAQNNN